MDREWSDQVCIWDGAKGEGRCGGADSRTPEQHKRGTLQRARQAHRDKLKQGVRGQRRNDEAKQGEQAASPTHLGSCCRRPAGSQASAPAATVAQGAGARPSARARRPRTTWTTVLTGFRPRTAEGASTRRPAAVVVGALEAAVAAAAVVEPWRAPAVRARPRLTIRRRSSTYGTRHRGARRGRGD